MSGKIEKLIRVLAWILLAVMILCSVLMFENLRSSSFGFSYQSFILISIFFILFCLPAAVLYYFSIPSGNRSAKKLIIRILTILFVLMTFIEILCFLDEQDFKTKVHQNDYQTLFRARWWNQGNSIYYTGGEYGAHE